MNNITPRTDLFEYLPDWYKPILDYQAILNAEIPQFEDALTYLTQVHQNFNIWEMDEQGVEEWEKIYKIPDTGESLNVRRARIRDHLWWQIPPFTERYLRQRLDELIGAGDYTLTMYYDEYRMKLSATQVAQTFSLDVFKMVNTVKPAHIVFEWEYLFNTWGKLGWVVWTGAWLQGNINSNGSVNNTSANRTRTPTSAGVAIEIPSGGVTVMQEGTTFDFGARGFSGVPLGTSRHTVNVPSDASWQKEIYVSVGNTSATTKYVGFVARYPNDMNITPDQLREVSVVLHPYTWGDMETYTWQEAREDGDL